MAASAPDSPLAQAVWAITPFIDVPGTYPNGARYEFQWEREWRVNSHLAFKPTDAAFLIIPAELHGAARSFFDDARQENSGPCYDCPFIDPRWDAAHIDAALGLSIPDPSA
jgi:hypothetical protein